MQVLALIPARSGSKGIPHKNIRPFRGKPLLAHSIEQARACPLIQRTLVSTDSVEYAEIARQYGAEVPFLRPSEISGDVATDLEVFEHALAWLGANEGYMPDICVHLRPTYPLRDVQDITNMIELLAENPTLDSVRSIAPAPDPPYKMWFRAADGILTPVIQLQDVESYNMPRQLLPQIFLQNACIDAVRTQVIREQHSMTGKTIYGYVMAENHDIDTEMQFNTAEASASTPFTLKFARAPGAFCFDIDGVIATLTDDNAYDQAAPQPATIQALNFLYERGYHIILFTARGSATQKDWTQITERQMQAWGVKYHELRFGKPPADYFVDDKMLGLDELLDCVDAMRRATEPGDTTHE